MLPCILSSLLLTLNQCILHITHTCLSQAQYGELALQEIPWFALENIAGQASMNILFL